MDELISEFYKRTINLVAEEKSDSEILSELIANGLPENLAQILLEKVKSQIEIEKGKLNREAAREYFIKGVSFLAIGAIVTGITYSMASNGGSYVVTTGLFVLGVIYTFIGLFKFLSS